MRQERSMEVYGSGKAPDLRILAGAFKEYIERMRDDPQEEAEYQAWLKEYRQTHPGK